MVKRMRTADWEKIVAKDITDNILLSKIYKDSYKFNNEKVNNPIKKWAKYLNIHITKEDIYIDGKYAHERYSISYIIREF